MNEQEVAKRFTMKDQKSHGMEGCRPKLNVVSYSTILYKEINLKKHMKLYSLHFNAKLKLQQNKKMH